MAVLSFIAHQSDFTTMYILQIKNHFIRFSLLPVVKQTFKKVFVVSFILHTHTILLLQTFR